MQRVSNRDKIEVKLIKGTHLKSLLQSEIVGPGEKEEIYPIPDNRKDY